MNMRINTAGFLNVATYRAIKPFIPAPGTIINQLRTPTEKELNLSFTPIEGTHLNPIITSITDLGASIFFMEGARTKTVTFLKPGESTLVPIDINTVLRVSLSHNRNIYNSIKASIDESTLAFLNSKK